MESIQHFKPIFISIDGEETEKILTLKDNEFRVLKTLKKKLLNGFGFEQSQGKDILINVMQVYPNGPDNFRTPILNDANLKLIIDFLISYERPIKIMGTFLIDPINAKRKEFYSQEAIEKGEIHFDENGSLIEENDGMKELIPNDQKYNNEGHVRCEFCLKNNKNTEYLKRCGGIYGPFGKEQKYAHLLCAIWCHQIHLNDDQLLMNVEQTIKNSEKVKCKICRETGAGLVCVGEKFNKKGKKVKCNKHFHFKCAYDNGSMMNWISFKMLCPNCAKEEDLFDLLQNENIVDENLDNIEGDCKIENDENFMREIKKECFL